MILPSFFVFFGLAVQEPAPEPPKKDPAPAPAPKESDPAALEFLKRVDEVMFHYPGAGVHSLTLKLKLGGNPMLPPEMREKMKDAALVYYWRQEPWAEAIDVVGLPPEMAPHKGSYLGKGVGGMRYLVPHSQVELAKHFFVTMTKEGDLTKVDFAPRDGAGDFAPFASWYDKNHKLVKGEKSDSLKGPRTPVDYVLTPIGTRYMIAEAKQAGVENGSTAKFEFGRSGEVPVLKKFATAKGPIRLEFPIEVELNPQHDPAIFPKK